MIIGIVILAGGKGERFHGKKQDLIFHGKSLWQHVYDKALLLVNRDFVVVVGRDVPGGTTRTGSVINGLQALPKNVDRVIILEAARPLVTENQLKTIAYDESQSTSFVMPLVNTPIGRDGTYYSRNSLYDLLVPQAFDYKLLLQAYETGKYLDMTDETIVMFKEYGIKPHLIETGQNLFKVTYPRDVAVLETIYQRLKEEQNA